MGINKKSRTSKVIAGFVGFATAVTMSFGTASAATTAELQAQIASLLATIQGLQAQLGSQTGGTTVGGYTFATNLTVGSKGADVMNLQKVLNTDAATQVAATGAGSPGNETTTFGPATKAAVIKFQEKYATDILAPVGLTKGTGFVGASMRAYLNAHFGGVAGGTTGGTTIPATGSVRLSTDTPAAGVIVAGQAIADLAHFTFPNTTGAELKITNLVFNRTGVSNDTTLTNVYLYNGANRLTDAAAVSSSKITFNDASGLFTIPAGGSINLAVKADIDSSSTGQIVGVALASVMSGTTAIAGTYPIAGNNMTIASAGGTMSGISWGTVISPGTAPDLQTGLVMWENTVTVTNRAVNFSAFTLRQIGSAGSKDLATFQLFVDGNQFGTTIASTDANGYLTFTSATPIKLETGNHNIKLVGDIIGGSTKTFSWSLQQAGDAVFTDSQLGVSILATSFTSKTTTTSTISGTTGGSLSIIKATDSPSGNVVLTGTNVVLGKFTLKAMGEPIKVEYLRVAVDGATTTTDYALRNGALYANGVQVGNTIALRENSHATAAYTEFSLGSSLQITPGTPVTLEVRADIYNTGATANALVSGDVITVSVASFAGSYKKMTSLLYNTDAPTATANQLAIVSGSISGAKKSSYANQTVVLPKTAQKVGSFTVTSTDGEDVNLNTINVNFVKASNPSVGLASGDVTDLYVVYNGKTSSTKATADVTTDSTSANSFSINEKLAANATIDIDVYATLNSTIGLSDTVIPSLYVSGLTAVSARSVNITQTVGQTISNSAGTLTAAVVTKSETAIKLLVGATTPKVATFRFSALNDTFKVTDIGLTFAGTQNGASGIAAGAINNVVLKASGMADKVISLTSDTTATSTGMNLEVPAGSTGKDVDVYLNLNNVGTGAATSSANIIVTLSSFKALTSAGTIYNGGTVGSAGQNMYVYKSVPTISAVSLPQTNLAAVAGAEATLAKFTISADNAGKIGWKKMKFTITKTTDTDIYGTSSMKLKDSTGTVIAGTFSTSTPGTNSTTSAFGASSTGGTIIFVADNEQEISTSETYSLIDTVTGTVTSGKYISTSFSYPSSFAAPDTYTIVAATGATFVWTDRSADSHGVGTADWNNEYKVPGFSTFGTQTLTGSGT